MPRTYGFDLVSVTMVTARLLATETVSSTALLPLQLPPPRSLSLVHLAVGYTRFPEAPIEPQQVTRWKLSQETRLMVKFLPS